MMNTRKKCIYCMCACLCLTAICAIVFYKTYGGRTVKPPDIPIFRYNQAEALQAYTRLKTEYESTLASHPNPVFRDSSQFTETGPQVGSLRKPYKNANKNRTKTVLLWTTFYGIVEWAGDKWCKGEVNTCDITTDKNDLLESDAVVMHPYDLWFLPTERLPNQRWVYFVTEPPYSTRINFADHNGVFNWTMTYRWDADFPVPYYNSTLLTKPLKDKEYRELFTNIMAKKRKLVAIMNGNCRPQSNRFDVVRELRHFIPVDFYGACGELNCSRESDSCSNMLSTYKFYLSFENSKCRNYFTEKVANPLHRWNAVPIVLGAPEGDYAKVMPPGSYIHVDGFSSVKKLAEFITLLDENVELYEKYHTWRQTHKQAVTHSYCDLCKALYDESLPLKSYTDFQGWYDQDICFPPYFFITNKFLLKIMHISFVIVLVILSTLIYKIGKRKCNN